MHNTVAVMHLEQTCSSYVSVSWYWRHQHQCCLDTTHFSMRTSLILRQMNKCIICAQPAVKCTMHFGTDDRRHVSQLHRLIKHEEIIIRPSACCMKWGGFRLHWMTVVFSTSRTDLVWQLFTVQTVQNRTHSGNSPADYLLYLCHFYIPV